MEDVCGHAGQRAVSLLRGGAHSRLPALRYPSFGCAGSEAEPAWPVACGAATLRPPALVPWFEFSSLSLSARSSFPAQPRPACPARPAAPHLLPLRSSPVQPAPRAITPCSRTPHPHLLVPTICSRGSLPAAERRDSAWTDGGMPADGPGSLGQSMACKALVPHRQHCPPICQDAVPSQSFCSRQADCSRGPAMTAEAWAAPTGRGRHQARGRPLTLFPDIL